VVLNFIWRISGVGAEGQLEDLECSTDLFFSFAPTVQVNTAGFPGKKRFGGSGWLKMCVSCGSCRPQRLVCNLGEWTSLWWKQDVRDEDQILGKFIQGVLNFIGEISGVVAECSIDLLFSFAHSVQVNAAGFLGLVRAGGCRRCLSVCEVLSKRFGSLPLTQHGRGM
jgi:hypothetical protein